MNYSSLSDLWCAVENGTHREPSQDVPGKHERAQHANEKRCDINMVPKGKPAPKAKPRLTGNPAPKAKPRPWSGCLSKSAVTEVCVSEREGETASEDDSEDPSDDNGEKRNEPPSFTPNVFRGMLRREA